MSITICEMGASELDPSTNSLLVQCKSAPLSEDTGDAEDFGEVPYMAALGHAARPFPANADGAAEALVAQDVPGVDAAVVGGRDTRAGEVYGQIGPGETAGYATGPGFDARTLWKKRQVATIVGDDIVVNIDGNERKIQATLDGLMLELNGRKGEITLTNGSATFQIVGDQIILRGTVMLGANPILPVHIGPGAGPTSIPSTGGVFA
jgi:hypothetical protein